MAALTGLCLAWSETPEDTFCHVVTHFYFERDAHEQKKDPTWPNFSDITVNFLNIRTPKKFVVITLKFELCGSTIE